MFFCVILAWVWFGRSLKHRHRDQHRPTWHQRCAFRQVARWFLASDGLQAFKCSSTFLALVAFYYKPGDLLKWSICGTYSECHVYQLACCLLRYERMQWRVNLASSPFLFTTSAAAGEMNLPLDRFYQTSWEIRLYTQFLLINRAINTFNQVLWIYFIKASSSSGGKSKINWATFTCFHLAVLCNVI